MSMRVGNIAVTPIDTGRPVPLGLLVGGQTALVVLLRHADCPFCAAHLARISAAREQLGRVIVVSFEPAERLRIQAERAAPSFLYVTDESRTLYRALATGQTGRSYLFRPSVLARLAGVLLRGRPIMRRGSDTAQLGADMLVGVGGEVLHLQVSRSPEHRPGVDELWSWRHGQLTAAIRSSLDSRSA